MTVADNVEAYAPGTPIFAWSGDDHLTGSSGADLFVFADPIGHDTIHQFDATADTIDLIGFGGFKSFEDVMAHTVDTDAVNGNAVITLADGMSIKLDDVSTGQLKDSNFVFDQEPEVYNSGHMELGNGAMLPLSGTINNSGTITLASTGSGTLLQLIEHGITLQGHGQVTLSDSDQNVIAGTKPEITLTNVDNVISGAGQIGQGHLTLINQGTIEATGDHALVIDTSAKVVVNEGTLAASGAGGLEVKGVVDNSGTLWAYDGNITIHGDVTGSGTAQIDGHAAIEFGAAASAQVQFDATGAGKLQLDDAFHFSGSISGFASNDTLDFQNLAFGTGAVSYTANTDGTGAVLSVTDGAHTAEIALKGQYDEHSFVLAQDTDGSTLVQYHEPVVSSASAPASTEPVASSASAPASAEPVASSTVETPVLPYQDPLLHI